MLSLKVNKILLSIVLLFLLLFAGIIALTQELETPSGTSSAGGEKKEEAKAADVKKEEPHATQIVKPVKWFRSNVGGMALEEMGTRFTALRYEYALAIDFTHDNEFPEMLFQYNRGNLIPEIRTLYKNGKIVRTQWILRDIHGTTRVNAVSIELKKAEEKPPDETAANVSEQAADSEQTDDSEQAADESEEITDNNEQIADNNEQVTVNNGQAAGNGGQTAAGWWAQLMEQGARNREQRAQNREQRTQNRRAQNGAQVTANSEQITDNNEQAADNSEQAADNGEQIAANGEQTAEGSEQTAEEQQKADEEKPAKKPAAVEKSQLIGFIEEFDEKSFLTSETRFYENGSRDRIEYKAKDNLIITATVFLWDEEKKDITASYADHYRYNRSLSLRGVEREFLKDVQLTEDPELIAFPKRIMEAVNEAFLKSQREHIKPEFFGGVVAHAESRIVYENDDRGRIETQTFYNENDEVVWIIKNTWSNDRIISTIKIEGENEFMARYQYAASGDRIAEHNYKNGVLERIVRTEGKRDIEELYFNNILVIKAIWENNVKISEERIR